MGDDTTKTLISTNDRMKIKRENASRSALVEYNQIIRNDKSTGIIVSDINQNVY
jgi:hypothetical protein